MRKTVIALALMALVVAIIPVAAKSQLQSQTQAPAPTASVSSGGSASVPPETWTNTYIVQEDFERGFMYWISTQTNIWVLIKQNPDDTSGEWRIYKDTFKDGEQEIDQSLVPPSVKMYQPRRGFGKIWRQPTNLFSLIGWGTTPEFEISTPIDYWPGFSGAPGRYILVTGGRQVFVLTESAPGQGGKWAEVGRVVDGNPNQKTLPGATAAATVTTPGSAFGPVVTPAATAQ
ncbi:MAG TPA: hypothetical protein VKQ72_19245 [Aggregatilineales bacterium]|nr:hypothetical protein [Aggregatilineales bacterium]